MASSVSFQELHAGGYRDARIQSKAFIYSCWASPTKRCGKVDGLVINSNNRRSTFRHSHILLRIILLPLRHLIKAGVACLNLWVSGIAGLTQPGNLPVSGLGRSHAEPGVRTLLFGQGLALPECCPVPVEKSMPRWLSCAAEVMRCSPRGTSVYLSSSSILSVLGARR